MISMSNQSVFNRLGQNKAAAVFTDLFTKRDSNVSQSRLVSAADTEIAAEKLKLIYEKSYKDGYTRGMNAGRDAAILIAQQTLKNETLSFRSLVEKFEQAQLHYRERAAEDLLGLALEIAKAMIKVELKIRPEATLPIIEEAIGMLPSLNKPMRLIVHPSDMVILSQHILGDLHELGWVMIEDEHIEPGGCRIETAVNTVDATVENRWSLICQALGHPNDWFETRS
jgi:flagellar assembly protein FliH